MRNKIWHNPNTIIIIESGYILAVLAFFAWPRRIYFDRLGGPMARMLLQSSKRNLCLLTTGTSYIVMAMICVCSPQERDQQHLKKSLNHGSNYISMPNLIKRGFIYRSQTADRPVAPWPHQKPGLNNFGRARAKCHWCRNSNAFSFGLEVAYKHVHACVYTHNSTHMCMHNTL